MKATWFILLIGSALPLCVQAQLTEQADDILSMAEEKRVDSLIVQKDAIDIAMGILGKDPRTRIENNEDLNTRLKISAGPIVEYMRATGVAYGAAISGAFLTDTSRETNWSSMMVEVKYTQRKQLLFPVQSSIWLPGNKFYLLGDWRYMHYPQDTYGFGVKTSLKDVYIVDYRYVRFYEYIFRKVRKNFYAGGGYRLDNHWRISERDVPPETTTDYTRYSYSPSSVSSGITFNLLFDTRKNSINPVPGGYYANIEYRQNLTLLGSDTNWSSLRIDLRKYIGLSPHTILALWSYNIFTLQGNPPYLDLPATGSDTYNNTGRGYEQGRFLGKHMIDLEAELRFQITRDGLLGCVVFANAESLSDFNNRFQALTFACGVGLRIKFNKFSNSNVCVDYGVGKNGENSFFGNLGEVF